MKRLFQQLWLMGLAVGALVLLVPRLGVVAFAALFVLCPVACLALGRLLFNPREADLEEGSSTTEPDVAAMESRIRDFFAEMRERDELAMEERPPPSHPSG